MSQVSLQQAALNVSTATTELVTKILSRFPQAHIQPRTTPLADEDISLEVILPLSMAEIYPVREWIYEAVIELQERYDLIILASAVPMQEELTTPRGKS